MPTNNKAQPEDRDRQRKALELRLTGMTYPAIATELGYQSPSGAYRAVEAVLKRVESEGAAELRKVEDMRLDALFRKYWPDAIAGDHKAAELVLKVHDRRVKLHGLAMPERVVVAQLNELSSEEFITHVEDDLQALGIGTATPVDDGGTDPSWSNI